MAHQDVQNGASDNAAAAVTFTTLKPQLLVEAPKASDAIQFYAAAFGAVELDRTTHPKRKGDQELPLVLSSRLEIAGSTIIISGTTEDSASPCKALGTGIVFRLETEDVAAGIARAVSAGAVAEGEITEGEGECGGGRVGKVKDPYGFSWLICSPAKAKCSKVDA